MYFESRNVIIKTELVNSVEKHTLCEAIYSIYFSKSQNRIVNVRSLFNVCVIVKILQGASKLKYTFA